MSNSDGDFRWKDGVSLKEYIDARLASLGQAVELAQELTNQRLQVINQFQGTLRDQAARLVTRDECALARDRLTADVGELREFRAALNAKASQATVYIAYGLSLISLAIAILNLAARW